MDINAQHRGGLRFEMTPAIEAQTCGYLEGSLGSLTPSGYRHGKDLVTVKTLAVNVAAGQDIVLTFTLDGFGFQAFGAPFYVIDIANTPTVSLPWNEANLQYEYRSDQNSDFIEALFGQAGTRLWTYLRPGHAIIQGPPA